KEEKTRIRQKIIERFMKHSPSTHFIIMGDFNAILNEELDRSSSRKNKSFKPDPLHTWLQKQSFTDIYQELAHGLLEAGIIDMSMTTESDHDIITTYLNLSYLTTNSGIAIVKRKAVKRTVFLYEEVKEEDWDQFRVELDGILKNKKAL
ncbi:38383_t:CDS:2, partial [Gigaspora margarita]